MSDLPSLYSRNFKRDEWNCTKGELEKAMKEDGADTDLKTESGARYFLDLKLHMVKGDMMRKHVETVMTLAGADLQKNPGGRRRREVVQEESLSYQEMMDLPDWTPFEGGCFMTVTKMYKGKPKHFTIFVDASGYRVLEKAAFVPPDTQPRPGFEKQETVEWDQVMNSLVNTFKEYLFVLDEVVYYVLACASMSTYFREVFDTYPYLDFYAAELECGKTTAMKCVIWSSFHGFVALDVTGPVLFRSIDSCKSAIGLDELDNLMQNPEAQSRLLGLLNSAYQKGLIAYRIDMEAKGMPVPYDPFGLKAFTHVNPIPASIQSRSVIVPLIRAPQSLPLLRTPEVFAEHRDRMYKLRLIASEEVEVAYNWVLDNTEMMNRPRDLFAPILTMAKLVSDETYSRIHSWANDYIDEQQTQQVDEVKRALVEVLTRYTGEVKVKILAEELSEVCHERGLVHERRDGRPYSFGSRQVVGMLASLGIHKTKSRTDGNVHVFIRADRVKAWCRVYQLKVGDEDKVPDIVEQLQSTTPDNLPEDNDVDVPENVGKGQEIEGLHVSLGGRQETSFSSFPSEESSKQIDSPSEDNDKNEVSGEGSLETSKPLRRSIIGDLSSFLDDVGVTEERTPTGMQVPDILKSLVRRWHSTETDYNDGIVPKTAHDQEVLLRGLEAGYVAEDVKKKLWRLTSVALEEIARWRL